MKTENKVKVTEQIENTPFTIVENENNELLICFGKLVICERCFNSADEAKEYLKTNMWNVVINMIAAYDWAKNHNKSKIK